MITLRGNWATDKVTKVFEYYINIHGTSFLEFIDDDENPNGIYDPKNIWKTLGSMGNIIDCINTAQNEGVMYIYVIRSDYTFMSESYIAVAYRIKNDNSIEFATGNKNESTLAEIKSTYYAVSAFPEGSFNIYTKQ